MSYFISEKDSLWISIEQIVCVSSSHDGAWRLARTYLSVTFEKGWERWYCCQVKCAEQPTGGCEGCQRWLLEWGTRTSCQLCGHLYSSRAHRDENSSL